MPHHLIPKKVLLVGAGKMALEYAKILQSLQMRFEVIGRGANSAKHFYDQTGIPVWTKGLDPWLKNHTSQSNSAIVAVNVDELFSVTNELLNKGFKKILAEKPGALNIDQIKVLSIQAKKLGANIYIAYNRRYYASVQRAKELLQEDGGLTSFHFEFTERSDKIKESLHRPHVKKEWFIANSTHLIDLAFYLGGEPLEWNAYSQGGLSWHPSASVFCGAGTTQQGILFSYFANWEGPGSWGLELITKKRRIILKPLEDLSISEKSSAKILKVELNDNKEQFHKPGCYQQIMDFLSPLPSPTLLTIHQQHKKWSTIYSRMIKQHP